MTHHFRLEIELGNDSMRTGRHVAKALREAARRIEADYPGVLDGNYANGAPKRINTESLRDENGNRIGGWSVKPEED